MRTVIAATIAAFAVGAGAATHALAAAPDQRFHAIVLVDVIPSEQATGSALLTGYVGRALQDPALSSITLIEQSGIPNHFILDEAFVSRTAYQAYIQQGYVRAFRAALYPHLGSPWDERLGVVFSPSQVQP